MFHHECLLKIKVNPIINITFTTMNFVCRDRLEEFFFLNNSSTNFKLISRDLYERIIELYVEYIEDSLIFSNVSRMLASAMRNKIFLLKNANNYKYFLWN